MKNRLIKLLLKLLGVDKDIEQLENRLDILEDLLLHKESKINGFAVLKKHLNRPDKPLPRYNGKEIEQD